MNAIRSAVPPPARQPFLRSSELRHDQAVLTNPTRCIACRDRAGSFRCGAWRAGTGDGMAARGWSRRAKDRCSNSHNLASFLCLLCVGANAGYGYCIFHNGANNIRPTFFRWGGRKMFFLNCASVCLGGGGDWNAAFQRTSGEFCSQRCEKYNKLRNDYFSYCKIIPLTAG